jgi:flagellar basal body rod protein FlgC
VSGATAVAAQQQAADSDPTSWMVEVLKARTAYRANAAVMKTAEKMSQETIDTIT